MAINKVERRKLIDKALISLGVVATLALLAVGGLAWWAYSFTAGSVHAQLVDQKIYFPAANSPALNALPAADRAQVAKYAGQQVLDGRQAEVFADHFIAVHLKEIAGGQTYSEISAKSLADPSNTELKSKAQTLFQGQTLRGLLLGDAYAFWTIGNIARIAALVAFVAGGVMFVLVVMGLFHLAKL